MQVEDSIRGITTPAQRGDRRGILTAVDLSIFDWVRVLLKLWVAGLIVSMLTAIVLAIPTLIYITFVRGH